MSPFIFKPPVSGAVLEQGKGALYRETLQATGCYVGRIVIATAEFTPMPPLHVPGYPGGLTPTAIGMRFRRHDGISLENTPALRDRGRFEDDFVSEALQSFDQVSP